MDFLTRDVGFMNRAMELAELGRGYTSPNPLVGAVLVHNQMIIGEGYHEKFGEAHAEVNAIHNVPEKIKHKISESTLYVNLEPCSHHGKTPPCTSIICNYNIPRVFVANQDPSSHVNGEGIRILQEQGVDVQTGLLSDKGRTLNRHYFTSSEKQRPYITLKWAQTEDALIAPAGRHQAWISDALAQQLTHRWRGQEQAIMVGTDTAIIDNPKLTCRLWPGENPLRVIPDRYLRLPHSLHIFNQDARTLIYTTVEEPPSPPHDHLTFVPCKPDAPFLPQIIAHLHEQDIQSVMVEGGSTLLSALIEADLWDEARIFVGRRFFGDGVSAPPFPAALSHRDKVGCDDLLLCLNEEHQ